MLLVKCPRERRLSVHIRRPFCDPESRQYGPFLFGPQRPETLGPKNALFLVARQSRKGDFDGHVVRNALSVSSASMFRPHEASFCLVRNAP